ncbi:hypothetical protein LWI29_018065 [Acer saccharum]|uniref:Uncharacterized protein n=1 Tax=Acer saccharum TaxID=4024 RepID=A0AA39SW10_ACESA|nr:hypothetical protein LWI29_018065 [Acer saccharum]
MACGAVFREATGVIRWVEFGAIIRSVNEAGGATVCVACGEDRCKGELTVRDSEGGKAAALARESRSGIYRGISCTAREWAWETEIVMDGDSWDSQVEHVWLLDLGRLTLSKSHRKDLMAVDKSLMRSESSQCVAGVWTQWLEENRR